MTPVGTMILSASSYRSLSPMMITSAVPNIAPSWTIVFAMHSNQPAYSTRKLGTTEAAFKLQNIQFDAMRKVDPSREKRTLLDVMTSADHSCNQCFWPLICSFFQKLRIVTETRGETLSEASLAGPGSGAGHRTGSMASVSAEIAEASKVLLDGARLANDFYASVIGLAIYDYLLTFSQEVKCVWKRKLDLPSILTILVRYTTVAQVMVLSENRENIILSTVCIFLVSFKLDANAMYHRRTYIGDALGVVAEATVLILTVIKIWDSIRASRAISNFQPIVARRLLDHGVVYFVSLLFLRIADVLVESTKNLGFTDFSNTLRGILVVRFLFDLREAQPAGCGSSGGPADSFSMIFGNLGSQIAGLDEPEEPGNEEVQMVPRAPDNTMV
ncbi:hypothetical protein NLI96_g8436 [Meripilus lineatus]|uniref:DUF6533 domain-containing protein n=1 Tax=Meripilus lineatus TaxID=2056292 RepID=A0AAD5UZ89_9APHY|nr:hypothetical protein NLI96_g8436 [Physisporinus lineatus]